MIGNHVYGFPRIVGSTPTRSAVLFSAFESMSAKTTLVGGEGFSLYQDLRDPDSLYLELGGSCDSSSAGHVRLRIPRSVWEVVRRFGAADQSLVGATDADLLRMATEQVDRRIESIRKDPDSVVAKLRGIVIYGSVDASREQQIQNAFSYYEIERARQTDIAQFVDQYVPRTSS